MSTILTFANTIQHRNNMCWFINSFQFSLFPLESKSAKNGSQSTALAYYILIQSRLGTSSLQPNAYVSSRLGSDPSVPTESQLKTEAKIAEHIGCLDSPM